MTFICDDQGRYFNVVLHPIKPLTLFFLKNTSWIIQRIFAANKMVFHPLRSFTLTESLSEKYWLMDLNNSPGIKALVEHFPTQYAQSNLKVDSLSQSYLNCRFPFVYRFAKRSRAIEQLRCSIRHDAEYEASDQLPSPWYPLNHLTAGVGKWENHLNNQPIHAERFRI